MEYTDLKHLVRERAGKWLTGNYDEETKRLVRDMLEHNEAELIDAFYQDLEFGTGGLRGIMGAGTNRMNIYTVGMATQGLSNYLAKQFRDLETIRVAIAYDSRNNSRLFADAAAGIFSANGFMVYLFGSLRPTPELSFAVREFGCQSGIVITASHNPKEYNGFKAYWDDGGQVISPHDRNIIEEVQKIKSVDEIRWEGPPENIEILGEAFDEIYLERVRSLSLSPDIIRRNRHLKIVYTPIHGSGVTLVPAALKKFGFENICNVPQQDVPDGNFPTVISPNPEEPAALSMAIQRATDLDADLVMATDPDADRVGIAVKNREGEFVLLNGNQTAVLLIHYLLSKWSEKKMLTGREYIVKTIVTTDLMSEIADKYGVEHFDVLTGFKYIADIIRKNEGKKTFIGGGEESYGFMAGEFVRDKDAVISCALIAEVAAYAADRGRSLFELLLDIYVEFGFYKESLVTIVKKGKSGAEEIDRIMEDFRNKPPESINGSPVMMIHDFQKQKSFDLLSHLRYDILLPKSNVLQFILKDGSKISMRPSGTEPKIKFYFGVRDTLPSAEDFNRTDRMLKERIRGIMKSLNIEKE